MMKSFKSLTEIESFTGADGYELEKGETTDEYFTIVYAGQDGENVVELDLMNSIREGYEPADYLHPAVHEIIVVNTWIEEIRLNGEKQSISKELIREVKHYFS